MPGRGGAYIKFGKIEVSSSAETLNDCVNALKKILDDIGYPESEEEIDFGEAPPGEDDEELEEVPQEEEGVEEVVEKEEESKPKSPPWLRKG